MRKFNIALGVTLLAGIFTMAAQPEVWSAEEIRAREDYAKATSTEAGQDAVISFFARGYGDTEFAVSVFPADPVGCDGVLNTTQADIGATLWRLGFRSISCTNFDDLGYAQVFRYKLLKPLPPAPFKAAPRHDGRALEASL
jgi:hypothetical protein